MLYLPSLLSMFIYFNLAATYPKPAVTCIEIFSGILLHEHF